MRFAKILMVLAAIAPAQVMAKNTMTAKDYLSNGEVQFLIRTCLKSFFQPGGQKYAVDRKRLAAMGMKVEKDMAHDFVARQEVSSGIFSFKKITFGPQIAIDRNRNKQNKLLHKDCEIRGSSEPFRNSGIQFTKMDAASAQKMLESEAKRMGFKPFKNKRGNIVWRKGEIAILLSVGFFGSYADYGNGTLPPDRISISGAHPKELR